MELGVSVRGWDLLEIECFLGGVILSGKETEIK